MEKTKWGTLLSCSISCFIAWLDFTIVNTAIPAIKSDLSATIAEMQWVINAFFFAVAVFIITLGRISDHVGRRKMNLIAVFCFGLFSLLAGLASSPTFLIFFRFIQGVACAAIIPSALALISHAFPGEEKTKAIGIWGGITGIAMAIGPAVGGFLVSSLSWRWIFYINVPFAAISLLLSLLYARESYLGKIKELKIDFKGLFLLTIGLGALIFYLMHAPDWGWTNFKSMGLVVVSILFLIFFYFSEKRSSEPIIPFALFTNRSFTIPTLVTCNLFFVFTSCLFLIPLYLIQMQHQEAYQAGLTILTIMVSITILSFIWGRIKLKTSSKKLILIGLIFYGLSTLLQTFFQLGTSIYYILTSFLLLGIGWGIARTPTTTSAIASAPHHYAGTATGVLWSVQNVAGTLSIAIVLTIFRKIFEKGSDPKSFMAGYQFSMWILTATTIATIAMIIFFWKHENRER